MGRCTKALRWSRWALVAAVLAAAAIAPVVACGGERDVEAFVLGAEGEGDGAWLGVLVSPAEEGALVSGIAEGSPAARAGLEKGDVIEQVDGEPVEGPEDLARMIEARKPGERVRLLIRHEGGQTEEVEVELAEAPCAFVFRCPGGVPGLAGLAERFGRFGKMFGWTQGHCEERRHAFLGVVPIDPSDALRSKFGAEPGVGVLVNEVIDDSPAQHAGIAAGDLILSVDGTTVTSARELRRAIAGHRPGEEVTIGLLRDGKELSVRAELAGSGCDDRASSPGAGGRSPEEMDEQVERALREALDRAREALERARERLRRRWRAIDDGPATTTPEVLALRSI